MVQSTHTYVQCTYMLIGSTEFHYNFYLLLGTSPELEMSLYTACLLAFPNEYCHVTLGGTDVWIQTWEQIVVSFRYNLIHGHIWIKKIILSKKMSYL